MSLNHFLGQIIVGQLKDDMIQLLSYDCLLIQVSLGQEGNIWGNILHPIHCQSWWEDVYGTVIRPNYPSAILQLSFCSSLAIKGHHVAFKGHQRPICVYIFLLSHNYLLSSATLQQIFGLSYIYPSIIFTSQMFNVGQMCLQSSYGGVGHLLHIFQHNIR